MSVTEGIIANTTDVHTYSTICCFVAGTLVMTDQGAVAIEQLNECIHTIRNKPIVGITRNITPDKFLICIEKGSLYLNTPSEDTIMTTSHKVLYRGCLTNAGDLKLPGVKHVQYHKETLYNVLMESYNIMSVNNMVVETLHPDNLLAKLYRASKTRSLEERNSLVNEQTIEYIRAVALKA